MHAPLTAALVCRLDPAVWSRWLAMAAVAAHRSQQVKTATRTRVLSIAHSNGTLGSGAARAVVVASRHATSLSQPLQPTAVELALPHRSERATI